MRRPVVPSWWSKAGYGGHRAALAAGGHGGARRRPPLDRPGGVWHRGTVPPADTPSTSPLPVDLVPLKEAARRVDRAPSTLRDWIRAGELRSFEGEGTHPRNRPTLVSVGELQALVVQAGKAAHPGRRPPVEEEGAADLRLRLATVEGELRALRVELDGERRAAAALQTAIQVTAEAAADLRAALDRERARADGAEAELRALRDVGALPWWRRLLPGPR